MGMSAAFLLSALVQFMLGLVVAWLLGPAEFGAYALAVAAGILLQTVCFEGLRLAATRFHHAGVPALRRRLLRAFAVACLFSAALAGVAFAAVRDSLPTERLAWLVLVPGLAMAAGFLDLVSALLRSQFREGDYARVLMVRNLLGITVVPLAAGLTGRAEAAGLALLASLALAGFSAWRREANPTAGSEGPLPAAAEAEPETAPSLLAIAGYAGPVVVTNLVYLALFLALRSWAAWTGGLALAGQVSLALDFVLKLFTTIGSALDLWLFQRAVQASRESGEAAGQAHLHRNAEIILAVLLAMATGLVLVIEALEPMLVRPDFRGPFGHAVMLLTPGVFLYALIQYAVHPYAQLARKTPALVVTALVVAACAGLGGVALALLPPGMPGPGLVLAMAMATGLALLAQISPGYVAPSAAALRKLALVILAMAVPVALIRQWDGGVLAALAAMAAGVVAFAATAWMLDLAGLRRFRRRLPDLS
jgi:O-antigen/teichoic acid export membrane protein